MKQNNSRNHFRSRNSGRRQNGASTIGVNTLIDSNGPCGKIKGTALQIMEKYLAAAKEASGSDRVLYENFMQHAEYFFRTHTAALAAEAERRESVAFDAGHESSEDRSVCEAHVSEDGEEPASLEQKNCCEDDVCAASDKSGEAEKIDNFSSDIIALDLSFPDVSKLGMPEVKAKNTDKVRKIKTKKEPKGKIEVIMKDENHSDSDIASAEGEQKAELPLSDDLKTETPKRKARCRKVQGL